MDAPLLDLISLAFLTAEARDATSAIDAMRAGEAKDGARIRSYELLLPAGADFAWLRDQALPRLVYHLESLKARPPSFGGMVISLFAAEKLHFIRAADFLPAAARLAGTTVDDLYERFGTGELRTAKRPIGPPGALPPKRE